MSALTDAPANSANAANAATAATPKEENKLKAMFDTSSAVGILSIVIVTIITLLWHVGAARLSYLKYGSIGWAILDFFFATIYYPFYALFLADGSGGMAPAGPMMGGGRMMKKMMKLLA
jgi:hypothetical protein